jgi:tripartite-type tricarboxylate transporter receptor subunit TctC
MDSKKIGIGLFLGGVFFLATSVAGWAQNYPTKPIRMIVPFAGAGPSGMALLGGHVDYRFCSASEALPNIRGGKIRGQASSGQRIPELPNVPGFEELGIAFVDFPLTLSFDLWGPLKLPKDIQDILAKALEKSLKDPEYIQFVRRFCYYPTFLDSQEVREKIGPKLAAFYKQ